MISKYDRLRGFNDKCETCECYKCNVDYAKLIGAEGSCLCKDGRNLICDSCRHEGNNTLYSNFEEPDCPYFAEEGDN